MSQPEVSEGRWPKRVRTPVLLQMEAVECGAASLGIMLAHFGRIEPLAILRRECGVSRDGSKASNVIKAARTYGLKAKGFSKELDALRDVEPPYIVFWQFNHFLVVEGFARDKVFLNDPAVGHRTVTFKEFDESFTGIVLATAKGEGFEPGGRKPSVIGALRARLVGNEAALFFTVLAGFLLVLPGLVIPALTQVFLDGVIGEGRTEWLRPIVLALFTSVAALGLIKAIQLGLLRKLRFSLAARSSAQFLWHLMKLPANFYAQRYAGEISTRTRLNDKVATMLSGQLASTAIEVVMMVFYAAMMFAYEWRLTLIGIGFAILNFAALRWLAAKRVEANMRLLQEYGKVSGTAIAGLQGMETMKASGQEGGFFARWAGYYSAAVNARRNIEGSNLVLGTLPTFLRAIATMLVLIVGGLRVIDGDLTIGGLVAFQLLMAGFLAPVISLVFLGSEIQELQGDMARLDDVLAHPTDDDESPDGEVAIGPEDVRLDGSLEIKSLTFGYSRLDPPLIEDFNLTVRPGERVALVGGSGSGKSTIARIVTGLYEPWSGEILFDGKSRGEIVGPQLHNSLALVDQDIMLFEGTVRENLTLWDETVPEPNLLRACEDAAILDDVLSMRGGLESELAEGGGNLSGGQRQRLEIARALVNDPSILVLDEGTSALDAETERVICDQLRMRGCTSLVIAHRLSTIRDCDEIVVMQQGQVVERGTHEELWKNQGHYAELIKSDDDPEQQEA